MFQFIADLVLYNRNDSSIAIKEVIDTNIFLTETMVPIQELLNRINIIEERYVRFMSFYKIYTEYKSDLLIYLDKHEIFLTFGMIEFLLRFWFKMFSVLYREFIYLQYGIRGHEYHFNAKELKRTTDLPMQFLEQLPCNLEKIVRINDKELYTDVSVLMMREDVLKYLDKKDVRFIDI